MSDAVDKIEEAIQWGEFVLRRLRSDRDILAKGLPLSMTDLILRPQNVQGLALLVGDALELARAEERQRFFEEKQNRRGT